MDRIEAMNLLLSTIQTGSFSAAARALRIPVQTVSRNIGDLEKHLGTQLLTRTTRKLGLTDAGVIYAAAAKKILEQVAEAERTAAGEFVAPRGELVISAPLLFGRLHVLPVVADFLGLFPEINVRLDLRDRNVDLLDDQIDMAVRIGHLPDSGMIATRVGAVRGVICASPKLLAEHGVPQTPLDLKHMPCIATDGPTLTAGWRFQAPDTGASIEVAFAPRLLTGANALVDAAVQGVGFARLLHYQAHEAIQAGTLRIVLEEYELPPFPIHILHAPHRHMPLKIRRFLDFASPRLRDALAPLSSP
ncbi:LysR family transcriptional regulator [Pseudomonas sp. SLFW]|uniref:LysR family transcriptional regulator n=1 Tax=Pseudomonas sp. SLFW TaxID=2683259 RepID=UPI003531CA77